MTFDLQPNLQGTLASLRPLAAADFDDLYAVAADPLIWEQHPDNDRHRKDVFRAFFRQALESQSALIVTETRSGRVIGSSRYNGYDRGKNEVEIGWTFLARSCWGGIYNKEIKHLMLQHAFKYVTSVVFLIGSQNIRSRRAMEKIGGIQVGTRPDGGGRDSLVYQITASAFADEIRSAV